MIQVANPSIQSLFLVLHEAGRDVGAATGFVVERGAQAFLVTNSHVVRPPEPPFPDHLVIRHNRAVALGMYLDVREPLYDHQGEPLWLEHPAFGRVVDVVALPLTSLNRVRLQPYDPWRKRSLPLAITDALSIVGFPFREMVHGGMGVWTRGFVATEPELEWNGLPAFLVDSSNEVWAIRIAGHRAHGWNCLRRPQAADVRGTSY